MKTVKYTVHVHSLNFYKINYFSKIIIGDLWKREIFSVNLDPCPILNRFKDIIASDRLKK